MSDISHPTGTITFLFTDIEGSTKRWEHLPDAMATALVRHDALLRSAIETHGGVVFKTVGDAFCAAFASAPAALAAALTTQRALAAEPWPEVGPVRVRMALHTGGAHERDGDYFGPHVNRVARLLATGAGEQTLLSGATAALVRDRLPASTDLLDLGLHRLKDLLQPERIFQATFPGLPAEFPPLNSLDRQPHNLPAQPTPLLGRETEVRQVCELMEGGETRLVTLTGPGGTGKTRLALQAAAELLDAFPDGAWFVDLAVLEEPDLVVPTIARPLGIRESGLHSLRDQLLAELRHKRLLLVLDNFEHVLPAAPFVGTLLTECPGVRVVATSRAPLRVYGEREFPISPLALPEPKRLPPLADLADVPAVALFVERAHAAKPGFALTEANGIAVAEICVRLDGLPLAIELAAARTKLLPPPALLARLTHRLTFLPAGGGDLHPRRRTMRDTIAWSYDLLDPPDQSLFARLSVFTGGFTIEAAETVSNADASLDLFDGIASLVDNSLLRLHDAGDEPRFTMLATIHEFAVEQRASLADEPALRDAHAAYFLALAEEAEPELIGSNPKAWLDRLESEHANLGAALDWLVERADVEAAARLTGLLWLYWEQRGYIHEGWARSQRLIELSRDAPPSVRAGALNDLGHIANGLDDCRRARNLYEESLTLCRSIDNRKGIASVLNNLGRVAYMQGDYMDARAWLDESRIMLQELGLDRGVAYVLDNLGDVAAALGDYAQARQYHEDALALLQAVNDQGSIAVSFLRLGHVISYAGAVHEARSWFEQGLELSEEVGDRTGVASALYGFAVIALQQGETQEAARYFTEALQLRRELGDTIGSIECIEGLARIAVNRRDPARGIRMLRAVNAIREALGIPRRPVDQPAHDECLSVGRTSLDDAEFQAAWTIGSGWSIDEATVEAMR